MDFKTCTEERRYRALRQVVKARVELQPEAARGLRVRHPGPLTPLTRTETETMTLVQFVVAILSFFSVVYLLIRCFRQGWWKWLFVIAAYALILVSICAFWGF